MSLIDTGCVGQVSSIDLAALGPNTSIFNFIFQVWLWISWTRVVVGFFSLDWSNQSCLQLLLKSPLCNQPGFIWCGSSSRFWDLLHVTCWLASACELPLPKNRKHNNIRYVKSQYDAIMKHLAKRGYLQFYHLIARWIMRVNSMRNWFTGIAAPQPRSFLSCNFWSGSLCLHGGISSSTTLTHGRRPRVFETCSYVPSNSSTLWYGFLRNRALPYGFSSKFSSLSDAKLFRWCSVSQPQLSSFWSWGKVPCWGVKMQTRFCKLTPWQLSSISSETPCSPFIWAGTFRYYFDSLSNELLASSRDF